LASTCLTMTAQYKLYLPSPDGRLPDTTATRRNTPVERSSVSVYWCFARCRHPSDDRPLADDHTLDHAERAPMKRLSSMIVGFA
jgi:hypothetical protein